MDEKPFGTSEYVPEGVRDLFRVLCRDLAWTGTKWDLFLCLYGTPEATAVLSDAAAGAFQVISESLRVDVLLAIARLNDPAQTGKYANASLAGLARQCPEVPDIEKLLAEFDTRCRPLKTHRDKVLSHNDLKSRIAPQGNPLPGLKRDDIEEMLDLAANVLNGVSLHYSGGKETYSLRRVPVLGDGNRLLNVLKVARRHETEERDRLLRDLG